MDAHLVDIVFYTTASKTSPVQTWLEGLDQSTVNKVLKRLARLKLGALGDYKSLKGGLLELRMHFGPGYRIYFSREGQRLVLLLAAGNKSSQSKDVIKARGRLDDYKRRQS